MKGPRRRKEESVGRGHKKGTAVVLLLLFVALEEPPRSGRRRTSNWDWLHLVCSARKQPDSSQSCEVRVRLRWSAVAYLVFVEDNPVGGCAISASASASAGATGGI